MCPLTWRIKKPYMLNYYDLRQLDKHPDLEWEDRKYSAIKQRIKYQYCKDQKGYCAYCRTEMEYKCHSSHIDHIVDKATHHGWRFTGLNLTLSCPQCNTYKLNKETLRDFARNAQAIPVGSAFYKIIHPHFDDYSRHIVFDENIFVRALDNDKGYNTIEICGLWRSLYIDRRGKHINLSRLDRRVKVLDKLKEDITPAERLDLQLYVDTMVNYL